MKVAVFGILRFPPSEVESILPHLKQLIDETYRNDGCIHYRAALDPFDAGLIRFSELWPDRSHLEAHLTAPHIEPWRTVAKAHGLSERRFESYDIHSEAVAV